jgi:hypothetical protein
MLPEVLDSLWPSLPGACHGRFGVMRASLVYPTLLPALPLSAVRAY